MKSRSISLLFGAALTFVACGKKPDAADKPAPVGSGSPTVGSGSDPAGPAAKNQTDVTDNDKILVVNAAQIDTAETTFNAPSGDRIPIVVAKRDDGGVWKIDITIGGALFETIDTKLPKDDANRVPVGSVVRIQNNLVVVAGTKTKTDLPAFQFDARVFTWDGKALALAKKIAFDHQTMPKEEAVDTHENAGRP